MSVQNTLLSQKYKKGGKDNLTPPTSYRKTGYHKKPISTFEMRMIILMRISFFHTREDKKNFRPISEPKPRLRQFLQKCSRMQFLGLFLDCFFQQKKLNVMSFSVEI